MACEYVGLKQTQRPSIVSLNSAKPLALKLKPTVALHSLLTDSKPSLKILQSSQSQATLNPFRRNPKIFKRASLKLAAPSKENKAANLQKPPTPEKEGTPHFARKNGLAISGSKVKMAVKPEQILTFRKMESCPDQTQV